MNNKIKIKNESENPNPQYKTSGSAGFDISANENVLLLANQVKAIKTGLYLTMPEGIELQIRSRSGMALNNQVIVLNQPGTIDSDYTGEIMIIVKNFSMIPFKINKGDRIAQGVFANYIKADFETQSTRRGAKGFGSTGIK